MDMVLHIETIIIIFETQRVRRNLTQLSQGEYKIHTDETQTKHREKLLTQLISS